MDTVVLLGNRLFMKFPDHSYFERRAAEADARIVSTDGMDDAGVAEAIDGAAAFVVIGSPITAAMIERATNLRFIMTLSVGYDVVDVATATSRGIPVSNCPIYCSAEVAEHGLTLAVALLRRLHELQPHVRAGGWDYKQARPIHAFSSTRYGICGLGRIGRQAARTARGLGMDVVGYDPYVDDDIFEMLGVTRIHEFGEFLGSVDVVSIHAPLTDETWHMFDSDAFDRMRDTAVLVNTARGPIVDQAALERALEQGAIAGAGIDVLETEPPRGDEPILTAPNAIVTPHIAWYSEESHLRNVEQGMDELVRVLRGERPHYVVNPQVFARR